jgi:hypothetical protein
MAATLIIISHIILLLLLGFATIMLGRIFGNWCRGYPWYWSWCDTAAFELRAQGQEYYADIIYGTDRGKLN